MKIFSSSARYFGLEVFNTACLSKLIKTKTDMSTKGMGQGLLGVLATLKITPKKAKTKTGMSTKGKSLIMGFS